MTISQALHLESERASAERTPRTMPLDDSARIAALEREVAALRAELAEAHKSADQRVAHDWPLERLEELERRIREMRP